jgi:hypothetical protein
MESSNKPAWVRSGPGTPWLAADREVRDEGKEHGAEPCRAPVEHYCCMAVRSHVAHFTLVIRCLAFQSSVAGEKENTYHASIRATWSDSSSFLDRVISFVGFLVVRAAGCVKIISSYLGCIMMSC